VSNLLSEITDMELDEWFFKNKLLKRSANISSQIKYIVKCVTVDKIYTWFWSIEQKYKIELYLVFLFNLENVTTLSVTGISIYISLTLPPHFRPPLMGTK